MSDSGRRRCHLSAKGSYVDAVSGRLQTPCDAPDRGLLVVGAQMSASDCHLCGVPSELQKSHIVPAFVFRWLRETSGNGHLRSNRNPNLRMQDGPKERWLCLTCEANFSRSEAAFANQIFHPYLQASGRRLRYGPWLLHFCVSVSWRTLRYHIQQKALNELSLYLSDRIGLAESAWRNYLLGNRLHPGEFRQHLVPMDQIQSASGELSPNINRYLMRAVQIDMCHGGNTLFTFTKLGRFMVLGFICEPSTSNWTGSRVNANQGTVEPRHYTMPAAFMGYLNDKANSLAGVTKALSERQKEKINNAFVSNMDRMIGSDFMTAMSADVEMFGSMAFHNNQEAPEDWR